MKYLFSIIGIFLLSGCIDKDFLLEPNLTRKAGGTILAYEWWYKNPNIKDSKSFGGSTKDYGASAEQIKDKYIIKWFSTFTREEISVNDLYKVKRSNKFWRKTYTKEQYMEKKKQNYKNELEHTVFVDDPMYNEFFVHNRKTGKLIFPTEQYWGSSKKTRSEYIVSGKKEMEVDDWEDDPNQFYYEKDEKDEKGNFIIYDHISNIPSYKEYAIVPIKQCFFDGWCLTYKDYQGKDLYVKKEALYK